jgi:hypothetical protein
VDTHGAVLISDPSPAIADPYPTPAPLTITFTLPDASGRFRLRQAPAYANADSDGCGVPTCVAAGPTRQGCASTQNDSDDATESATSIERPRSRVAAQPPWGRVGGRHRRGLLVSSSLLAPCVW